MPVAAFIWLSAWLVLTGWTLSALHQLNAVGYSVSLLLFVVSFWIYQQKDNTSAFPKRRLNRFFRRCRRPQPAIFFLVAALIFLGGALHAPNNFDALTYRLPRMLHWLAARHWCWISTFDERMNYSGVGWEWIALPFFAMLHSDRGMFLINVLGFLLMPGLLFSIFRNTGVARKAAWTWMWLLPLAYGYATQAGSIGNDLTGTIFFLASIYFGLRSRRSQRVSDVWLAILAAALMTGVKLSNLPLMLPCLVTLWPSLPLLLKNKFDANLAVACVALLVSAAPMMVLNQLNAGSWNGDPENKYKMQLHNPVAALLGNSFLITEHALMPPVLVSPAKINDRLTAALPGSLLEAFPRLHQNRLIELPTEEGAGLGLIITGPLLIVLGATLLRFRFSGFKKIFAGQPPLLLAIWIATLFYMVKMGSESAPRLLLPYYPLAITPILLLSAQSWLLRQRWWRIFLCLAALSVLPAIIFSVSRPLWPAQTFSQQLAQAHPQNKTLQRMAATYATYAHRNDFLAPLRTALPAAATEIGFIAGSNDSDYSLWRPVGQRTVKYLRLDTDHFLQQPEASEWVIIKENVWPEISSVPLETWAREHHAKIVLSLPLTELLSWGPENWCVLHFEKSSRANQ